jgi:hypothetical protein
MNVALLRIEVFAIHADLLKYEEQEAAVFGGVREMRKSKELKARDSSRIECSSWRSLLLLLFDTRTSDSCMNNEAL